MIDFVANINLFNAAPYSLILVAFFMFIFQYKLGKRCRTCWSKRTLSTQHKQTMWDYHRNVPGATYHVVCWRYCFHCRKSDNWVMR